MALSLALVFYYKGANIHFVSSKNLTKQINFTCKTYEANSVNSHLEVAQKIINKCESKFLGKNKNNTSNKSKIYFIGAGAMSDYYSKNSHKNNTTKIKKTNNNELNLELIQTIDVLKNLNSKNLIKIGFKCEINTTYENAKQSTIESIKNKNLKLSCLNVLKGSNSFGKNDTDISIFENTSNLEVLKYKGSKLGFALNLAKLIKNKKI
jgi:phosphopantothenoylcysteine synthetase/decarboxylase